MQHFTFEDLMHLEKRYRGTLMNQVAGYKPANLIGTCDEKGNPNLAIFNSVIHIGANPPYMGFILRPHTVERHTYENIKATGFFTLNQVSKEFFEKAHQTSAKYPRERSEFDAVGLDEWYLEGFSAPFVQQSPIRIGLSFVEEQLISVNETILLIGKVEHLILPDNSMLEDGSLRLDELAAVAIGGLNSYYEGKFIDRLDYALP